MIIAAEVLHVNRIKLERIVVHKAVWHDRAKSFIRNSKVQQNNYNVLR